MSLRRAAGCGYSLAGRGSFLPAYIKTIGVPTFTNRTTVFNLETMLTQKVRAEFIGRGKYQILPEATGVDALLTGEVTARQHRAGELHAPAARVALRDHDDGARSSCATCARTRCSGRIPSLIFRQEYDATERPRPRSIRPRSSVRTPMRSSA